MNGRADPDPEQTGNAAGANPCDPTPDRERNAALDDEVHRFVDELRRRREGDPPSA